MISLKTKQTKKIQNTTRLDRPGYETFINDKYTIFDQ